MSLLALFGALESGLIYALVALGVYISFRVLDFPDLTADGSFPLGGAVAGVAIIADVNPWLACIFGMLAGGVAGLVTAWLHVKLGILQLLSSILVMVALYAVNLRIMQAPNLALLGEPTIFGELVTDSNGYWMRCVVIGGVVIAAKFFLDWFFSTEMGLAMRATGSNLRMSQAQGIATSRSILLGMAISNGLIALAGAIFVQTQGGADISIGVGTIVIGLAAVIIGETIIPAKKMLWITLSAIVGAILYKFFIQIALSNDTLRAIGFGPQDVNLVTALLVVIALILPKIKSKILSNRHKHAA
ncbi:ABC transporter permease [Moraxella osloensis]|jgi:putative ABC transport system permease protein|uniref:ABC transporter permease n=2 Tax=Pseudomonadota TaxID=1224 RepID=A0A4V1FRL3_FAUOS|nr:MULTISPECIES: ABC transporter permease [Pseudomonadota]RVU81652.1 ABC transporter permease [Leucothrix sargassi]GGL97422.1 ABC transporter permease [Streptomyces cinereus]HBI50077.1 ABC transporter permease [Moraxellaceae bacterium]KND22797.1 ABC transporter permease [Enhydrobacter aerosaccus]MBD3727288.1 ABC transporter permease [Moraxella osloensis]